MAKFINIDRDTELLLSPNLRDWMPADHLMHLVMDAVDLIDVSEAEVNERGTGSAQYPRHAFSWKHGNHSFSYAACNQSKPSKCRVHPSLACLRPISAPARRGRGQGRGYCSGQGRNDCHILERAPKIPAHEQAAAIDGGTPMTTPREVAESYWAAECRRDIDAIMAHYHEDATYQDAGGLLRGQPAIRTFYEKSAREYPGLEVRILREYVGAPDSSALEVQAILINPAGRRYRIHGLIAIKVRDGRIVALRCYEDPPVPEQPDIG